jgi:hypothetical protein
LARTHGVSLGVARAGCTGVLVRPEALIALRRTGTCVELAVWTAPVGKTLTVRYQIVRVAYALAAVRGRWPVAAVDA